MSEEAEFRESVRRFLAAHLPERTIRQMDRDRRIPTDLWKKFAEMGWMGLSVAEEYGGAGANAVFGVILAEELARRFPSLADNYIVFAMLARALQESGTEIQKSEYLPRLARGEFMVGFGITEPGGGTDVLALRTTGTLEGGQWRVNGQKLYTTFADDADAILVLCRTDPPEGSRRGRGLTWVLVPRHQPGVKIRRLELMARRASGTCETFLDNALAPEDALLGERGRGWYQLLKTLDEERILAAAISVGIMQGALDEAVNYARDRTAFGRSIGAFQAIQHPIAEIATDLAHARALLSQAASMLAAGENCSQAAVMTKLFASEAAIRATDRTMRIMAAYGLVEESPMERLFRDARLGPFSPISNEMAKNIIAENLGLERSY